MAKKMALGTPRAKADMRRNQRTSEKDLQQPGSQACGIKKTFKQVRGLRGFFPSSS